MVSYALVDALIYFASFNYIYIFLAFIARLYYNNSNLCEEGININTKLIGNRILELRKAKKLSRAALGKMVDLHESNVKRFEDGAVQTINLNKIDAFAKALDTTTHYLLALEYDEECNEGEAYKNKDLDPHLIGSRIYECRKYKKLSRATLGKMVNLHESSIKRYEDGEMKTININVIENIAEALGVDLYYLLALEYIDLEEDEKSGNIDENDNVTLSSQPSNHSNYNSIKNEFEELIKLSKDENSPIYLKLQEYINNLEYFKKENLNDFYDYINNYYHYIIKNFLDKKYYKLTCLYEENIKICEIQKKNIELLNEQLRLKEQQIEILELEYEQPLNDKDTIKDVINSFEK